MLLSRFLTDTRVELIFARFVSTEPTAFPTPEIEPERLETVPETEPDEPEIAVRMSQLVGLQTAGGGATQLQDAMSIVIGAGAVPGKEVNCDRPICCSPD